MVSLPDDNIPEWHGIVNWMPGRIRMNAIVRSHTDGSSGGLLLLAGLCSLGYATALLVLLDIKSTREERWLADKFPDYSDYQRRVPKLIPFIR
jgi:protein-S-isoprenylcysteine O-methyltransferase Ste14